MGDRSTIAILNKDGTVESVYTHWNGFLSGNGETLYQHYRDVNKIKELIAFGSINFLQPEISPPKGASHTMDKPYKGVTTFYERDAGEKDDLVSKYESLENYLKSDIFQPYNYIFHEKKNEWYLINHDTPKFQKLTNLLKNDEEVSEETKRMIEVEEQAKKLNKELKKKENSPLNYSRYKL